MNRKTLFVVIMVLALASSMLFSAVATPAATVKLTKNTIISTTELQEAVDAYTAQGYSVSALQILQTMISTELLKQGAERDGFVVTEEMKTQLVASYKSQIEAQVGQALTDDEMLQLLGASMDDVKDYVTQQYILQSYVTEKKADMFNATALTPTDKEIDTFFRKNASQFVNPEAVKIALVVIPKDSNSNATKDAANKKTLEDALSQIKSGKLTFEKAVSTYSQDQQSKNASGEVGWLTIDNTEYQTLFGDEFYEAAFELDDGEIAPKVIDSGIGYVILKVIQHTQFKVLTLDDVISPTQTITVSEYIAQTLYSEKLNQVFTQASAALVEDLRKDAKINILYKEAN